MGARVCFFSRAFHPLTGCDKMSKHDDYAEYLRTHGRKQTTIDGYLCSIRACERCLKAGHRPTAPDRVDEESFHYLRAHLRLKETSMQTRMRAYGEFIEWCTGTNPMRKARILWNPMHYERIFITRDDFARLVSFFSRAFYPPSYRLMLMLGGMMGLRRTEIASLTVGDIRGAMLTIHGKGHGEDGNVQTMRIPPEIRDELEQYLMWRKDILMRDGVRSDTLIIFTEKYGHASAPTRMKDRVSYHFARMAKESGIPFTPHSLRRLFATSLYESGIDIQIIARLMRHANPSITWRYIRTDDCEAQTVIENIGYIIYNREQIQL